MLDKFVVHLPKSYTMFLTYLIDSKRFDTVESVFVKGLDLILQDNFAENAVEEFVKMREYAMLNDMNQEHGIEFEVPSQICMYCREWKRNASAMDGWCCVRSRNLQYDDTCDEFASI